MIWRWVKRILLGFLILILSYLVAALVLSFIPTQPEQHQCQKSKIVFVASNGIHLDYFIPTIYLEEEFLNKLYVPKSAAYLSFGWGDKQFYVKTPEWSDLSVTVTLRALFINSESAVHVGYYSRTQPHWVKLELCDKQFEALISYIKEEFREGINGNYYSLPGYGPNDRFFDGISTFKFYKTCNVWVNNGLKAADVKTAIWSPFDFGVLHHVRRASD